MGSDGWITFGLAVAIGLPLVVLVAVLVWPERIPPDRTVEAIRQRIEDEDDPRVPPE
ncbi:hypothetical protein OHA40_12020 [Nocardia sp. NBC_00508]|uniref:hypothetical protein n=1 Tax=Nocardia sp. NBC_00508 TaxID=2975992 RepID=UPI002E803FC8|nr:hypothetical protein [Nocardia sp. NBC_00508]WUD68775.1 hypothetical protein OHA40_12020 [Nocardia sp. NBC_00508]